MPTTAPTTSVTSAAQPVSGNTWATTSTTTAIAAVATTMRATGAVVATASLSPKGPIRRRSTTNATTADTRYATDHANPRPAAPYDRISGTATTTVMAFSTRLTRNGVLVSLYA